MLSPANCFSSSVDSVQLKQAAAEVQELVGGNALGDFGREPLAFSTKSNAIVVIGVIDE